MEVTSVRKYKGTTYEVEIDYQKKYYLHIDIIYDFSVCEGMQIEREELRKIIYASNFRRSYQYALYCLDYRDYSSQELYQKILKVYKNQKLCAEVIKKLENAGLVDDVRYAERLAEKLVTVKKYGVRRAKREIMLKGIDEFTAEDALEPYRNLTEENILCLLEKKYARYLYDRNDRKNIEKVKNALVRYGYGFDEINHAVRNYFGNAESED